MPDPIQVRRMFARIARRYDFLNHALSAGIDRRWRARAVERAGELEGRFAIDACSGTGDLALALAQAGARVVGVDFTPQMLERARAKGASRESAPLFVQGDALHLPIAGGSADLCTVAFGLRNVADRRASLLEMLRVLRPGGLALVLEFATPRGRLFGGLYRSYFTRVLPALGRLVSGDGEAYSYLPRTVLSWPAPEALESEMRSLGFLDCGHELLSRGIACLHFGRRPPARAGGAGTPGA